MLGSEYVKVGEIKRVEVDEIVVAYTFDLETNELNASKVPNPAAGKKHLFNAWRIKGCDTEIVSLRQEDLQNMQEYEEEDDE